MDPIVEPNVALNVALILCGIAAAQIPICISPAAQKVLHSIHRFFHML
jgi:hypothetical protein